MNTSRRNFLRGIGGATMFTAIGGCNTFLGKSGKIRLAACGVMGKGFSDWFPMIKSGLAELVAWCDADANMRTAALTHKKTKDAGFSEMLAKIPFYTDYRRMLDDQAKLGIEAMTVSTPDHMHAAIAVRAMKMGIHVYVQKPLVRTLWEAKYFGETAKEYGVITQMGNQGSGGDGFRRNVEVVQSGILGDVTEVHVWTNRPIWPQGFGAMKAATTRDIVAAPDGLDWNAWLGVAAGRPYRKPYDAGTPEARFNRGVFHAFNWRGFFDFGAGAFGDMACHTMNLPYRGLELGIVTKAECTQIVEANSIAFPVKSTVKMTYAPRDSKFQKNADGTPKHLPAVTLFWYDGDQQKDGDAKLAALMPQVVGMPQYKGKVPRTGCLIVGTKGILCSCADYGQQAFIALKGEALAKDVKDHEACKAIAKRIPRRTDAAAGGMDKSSGAASLSADGHYIEFLDAINGNGPIFCETHSRCYADAEFSVPMLEGILVGTVAQQVPGELKWDTATQTFDNSVANTLVKPVIRNGFEF